MPNHISTTLRVTGTPTEIERFQKQAVTEHSDGKSIFSFKSFVPCPPELHEVSCPVDICTEEDYEQQEKNRAAKLAELKASGQPEWMAPPRKITEAMREELRKKYFFDNWYDWNTNNWGTKWDCYEVSEQWEETNDPNDELSRTIKCFYQTAWSPATSALQSISELYPTLRFEHRFADEGGGFIGYEVIQDGETIEDVAYDWKSSEAVTLRQELGMNHYDESEESEESEE